MLSGAKADERPVRFQLGEPDYMVEEVLDQWYGSDDSFFKVRTDDRNLYILLRSISDDEWRLESFRSVKDYRKAGRRKKTMLPKLRPHEASLSALRIFPGLVGPHRRALGRCSRPG